jgi:hypothetical protein
MKSWLEFLRGFSRGRQQSFQSPAVIGEINPGAARGAFNLVFEISGVRIFTASLLEQSHLWVTFLGQMDVVIFSDPWYAGTAEQIATRAQAIQEAARFPGNLYFLCNDWHTYHARKPHVRNAVLVSQNCFIEESRFYIKNVVKSYDALYNARRAKQKRHFLASKVAAELRLALIYPHHDTELYDVPISELPRSVYSNKSNLTKSEICDIINQSRVGLILSDIEGACFASTEYLLCGVPVVSTPSVGGRSFWYTDENSMIVDADPLAILGAVKSLIIAGRDPDRIRNSCLELVRNQRQAFLDNVLWRIKESFSLTDWDYISHFCECRLHEEFGLNKDVWIDIASICRRLQG